VTPPTALNNQELQAQVASLEIQIKRLFQTEKELFESKSAMNRHLKRINTLNEFGLSSLTLKHENRVLTNYLDMLSKAFTLTVGGVFRIEEAGASLTDIYLGFQSAIEPRTAVAIPIDPLTYDTCSITYLNRPFSAHEPLAALLATQLEAEEEGTDELEVVCTIPIRKADGTLLSVIAFLCESGKVIVPERVGASTNQTDLEFVELSRAHCESTVRNVIATKLHLNLLEQYRALNENLEEKVAERTATLEIRSRELFEKSQDIESVFDHIQVGILVVSQSGKIGQSVSRHTGEMFKDLVVADMEIWKLISAINPSCGPDIIAKIKNGLENTLGEDSLNFELNKHVLPLSMVCETPGTTRYLTFTWDPIVEPDTGRINRMIVLIRDVSTEKQLEFEKSIKDKKTTVLSEILENNKHNFDSFIDRSIEEIQSCLYIIDSGESLEQVRSLISPKIHTIKGNARLHGFTFICDKCHEVEDVLLSPDIKLLLFPVRSQMQSVLNEIRLYKQIFEDTLRNFTDKTLNRMQLFAEALDYLEEVVQRNGSAERRIEDVGAYVGGLRLSLSTEKLSSILSTFESYTTSMAFHLKKHPPLLASVGLERLRVRTEYIGLFKDIFQHLYTNCVDHGLETDEERLLSGKAVSGVITTQALWSDGQSEVTIEVFDDGRGLDLDKIRARYSEAVFISDAYLNEVLFTQGFTSKDQATRLSGRGIGMSSVKAAVRALGGDIVVQKIPGSKPGRYAPFKFVLKIPTAVIEVCTEQHERVA